VIAVLQAHALVVDQVGAEIVDAQRRRRFLHEGELGEVVADAIQQRHPVFLVD